MTGYEKLIKMFRDEGSKKNPPRLQLGVMENSKDVSIGKIILNQDDYYISEHLTKPILTKLKVSAANGVIVDESDYLKPLAKNDIVLMYQVSDEKFVIIDKVVSTDVPV